MTGAWQTDGVATNWKIYARNKKSLGLELRKPEARDILLNLLPTAAVFVESFRPGTLEEMDLGPDVLRHRLVLSYEALSEGLTADAVVAKIMSKIPPPAKPLAHEQLAA